MLMLRCATGVSTSTYLLLVHEPPVGHEPMVIRYEGTHERRAEYNRTALLYKPYTVEWGCSVK